MFTYEEAMRPILTCLTEQPELQAKDIAEAVATHFRLSEADRGLERQGVLRSAGGEVDH